MPSPGDGGKLSPWPQSQAEKLRHVRLGVSSRSDDDRSPCW